MRVLNDPFFWALVSMSGLLGAAAVVASARLALYRWLGALCVALFALGRVVLVLPFVPQPRFSGAWSAPLGAALFAAGMMLALAALRIRPFTGPAAGVRLQDRGFYALVRNPLYLGELLWCLGLALLFRSTTGVALVPLWWVSLWLLTLIEEERLGRELGPPYEEYKRRVRGRIVPGLPL